MSGDSWDGYATERNELLGYLRTEGIKNVVVLSGDIHAAFAGQLMDDFDAATPAPVACELVGPGITSNSLYSFVEFATRLPANPTADQVALRSLVAVDATAKGGSAFTENFNMLLLHGTVSAGAFAQAIGTPNVDFQTAVGAALARKTEPNPHLQYVDTNAQGYGYVKVTADQVAASIVTINRPVTPPTDAGPGIKRTANVTIQNGDPTTMATTVTGTRPFPLG
jgi:alkaline phosphatase D